MTSADGPSASGLPSAPAFRSPVLDRPMSKLPTQTQATSGASRPFPSAEADHTLPYSPPVHERQRMDSFFGGAPAARDPPGASQIQSEQYEPPSPQPVVERSVPVPTVNLQNHHEHDRVPYHHADFVPGALDEDEIFVASPGVDDPSDRPSSFYGLDRHIAAQDPYPPAGGNISPVSLTYQPQEPERKQDRATRDSLAPAPRTVRTESWSGSQQGSNRMSTYRNSVYGKDGFDGIPPPLPGAPLLDHSHLKPGTKAKLLNHAKTLELYRANAKKTNDVDVMFEFACFLMDVVKEMNDEEEESRSINSQNENSPTDSKSTGPIARNPEREKEKVSLTQESIGLLQKLANRGHVQSQFMLADCYTKAIGTGGSGLMPSGLAAPSASGASTPVSQIKGSRQDYDRAFPLFVLAAKHGHVEAMFRAGQCCEHGWGTRKERDKALQFYRKAAIAQHPLAMYRLGLADLNGDLGQPRRPKDGVKWLKRAAETADATNPKPLHELALLHERGIEHVVFVDFDYAVELLARAAELGYAPSAYKLGECYEYGQMGCPQDSALSIHYYNIAAQQNHKEACFALTAWYLVGSAGVLPQSDTEAYLWAKKAAEAGLPKAEYAVGYFTEVGIGTIRNEREAMTWFRKAAEHGDKRAKERLKNGNAAMSAEAGRSGLGGKKNRSKSGGGQDESGEKKGKEDCVIM